MKLISKLTMVLSGLVVMAGAASAEMIQIKGSDTTINLTQKLAEIYMQQNPAVKISVTGGGSGTGIAALINKKCSIANASRAINAKEMESATTAGVSPTRIVIAIDGLSVVVNADNTVNKLTWSKSVKYTVVTSRTGLKWAVRICRSIFMAGSLIPGHTDFSEKLFSKGNIHLK